MGFCKRTWNLGEPIRDLFLRLAISGLTKIHHEAFIDVTFLGLIVFQDWMAGLDLAWGASLERHADRGRALATSTGMDFTMVCLLPRTGEIGFMSYFVSMTLIALVQFDIYVGSHWGQRKYARISWVCFWDVRFPASRSRVSGTATVVSWEVESMSLAGLCSSDIWWISWFKKVKR